MSSLKPQFHHRASEILSLLLRGETGVLAIEDKSILVTTPHTPAKRSVWASKKLKIANYPGVKNKVVKPSLVESIQRRGGICCAM